jgi:peptidylprolyl isomerase
MSNQNTTGKQPTAAERAAAAKGRSQALIGAAAGFAVIAVLIGTFVWVQQSDDSPPAASAPASADVRPAEPVPTAEAPAEQPAPEQPAQPDVPPALAKKPVVKAGAGDVKKLVVTPLIKGSGPVVAKGQTITVNYVGSFYKTGEQFDASWERGQLASFPIGVGQVIKGWDQGLVGVKVGSRVQLDIPAALGYGEKPEGGRPGGPLRFVVDVIAAQ